MDNSALHDDYNENDDEDDQIQDQGHQQQQSQHDKPKNFFLELALILLFFGNNLPATLLTNQILKQTCIQFGYNSSVCDVISQNGNSTKEIEKELQPYVANIQLTISLVHTIIPAILSLFLGPWSDIYGRKKILNSTFMGYAITLSLFACVCYYSEFIHPLSPWYYAMCYIFASVMGGWPSLLTATLCYITDTTEESKRAYRLTLIEMIIFIGVLFGSLSCSIILSIADATTVFIISASCAMLASFIVIAFVEESVDVPRNVTTCEKIKSLISPVNLVVMLKTCFKRRSFKERRILLCLILILMLTVFTFNGQATVGYLFERVKFGWTLKDHNYYDSTNIILTISGAVIGLTLLKKTFKMSDMSLTCLALFSGLADALLKAFAFEPWHMYTISSISLFRILSSPMCRTLISSIIPQNEIGKIFSITTSFEALSSFAAAPLYTFVYDSTFTTFAGAFFLITSAVYLINIMLALYASSMKKIRETLINPYAPIEEN